MNNPQFSTTLLIRHRHRQPGFLPWLILGVFWVFGLPMLSSGAQAQENGWPGEGMSPVFLWEDARSANEVAIEGRSRPRACKLISLQGKSRFGRHFGMETVEGAIFADPNSGLRVFMAAAQNQALGIEALVTPAETPQDGWILALAGDGAGGFALAQRGEKLLLDLATDSDEEATEVLLGTVSAGEPVHVVVNLRPDQVTAWMNGEQVTQQNVETPFTEWSAENLVFGGSWALQHTWNGNLKGVAIYPEPLNPETVSAHARHWQEQVAQREPLQTVKLKGHLLESSPPADAANYPRSLVAYRYKVEEVLEGEDPGEHVVVYHWGVLGGEKQEVLNREIGETYELTLAPYNQFPALETEHKVEDVFDPEAGLFYDLTR